MTKTEMQALGHRGTHQFAPKAWTDVANLTGDYDLDATIEHRGNKDLPNRLSQYVKRDAYAQRTAYNGYRAQLD
jgi:hypothetical protein